VEITQHDAGDHLEVTVSGRLDAAWADHLARALDEAVRGGAHRIRLDMGAVSYMSSIGLRVLLRIFKQLQKLQGSFAVVNPSDAVKSVLELAGLGVLLASGAAGGAAPGVPAAVRTMDHAGARVDVYDVAPAATLRCRVVGDPVPLARADFAAAQCRRLACPATIFGLGLGAFGEGFDDCRDRFGEFLCAGGAAAYLPTDGGNVPDFLVTAGALVPQVHALYALLCEGGCRWLARFDGPGGGALPLATVAEIGLDIGAADTVGLVMVAESAGLMGAALRRSPAHADGQPSPFAHPAIREWLSYTPERAHGRSLVLVVGVATRDPRADLAPLVRPLATGSALAGHFHAAAFSYRPLQKGPIELQPTVSALFDGEHLEGVLHLVNDDRPIVGAGQSEFLRGACWIGPITDVTVERD
jgi:anti-anti-sigma factor